MELSSNVDLAVRLVNTAGRSRADGSTRSGTGATAPGDRLQTVADLRALLLEESAAVRRINLLLASIQITPRLTGHDGAAWHLHFAEGAQRASEGFASAAVLGVAVYVGEFGFSRLGTCQSGSCQNVFIDTSSNRSRRYCSDRCATRANVAAYRARQRDQTADRA